MDFVTVYLIFGLIAVASLAYFSVGEWLYQRGITLPFYVDMTEEASSVSPQDYDNPPAADAPQSAADQADGGLSAGLSGLSALQQSVVLAIMLDSSSDTQRRNATTTTERLVELLVLLGWNTGEIRKVVKGDNNALSAFIAAIKTRHGIRDERVIGVGRDGREVRL